MWKTIIQKAAEAAKAIIGVATPIVVAFAADAMAELSASLVVAITAGATGAAVWLTPNRSAN